VGTAGAGALHRGSDGDGDAHARRRSAPAGDARPALAPDTGGAALALERWYRSGDTAGLDGYSAACLRRVWRAEHFTFWMTSMLHRFEGADAFDVKLQLAQLEYVCSSKAAATTLAENYVGLERV